MNKKGMYEQIIRIISWIAFLAILLGAIYFLTRRFIP